MDDLFTQRKRYYICIGVDEHAAIQAAMSDVAAAKAKERDAVYARLAAAKAAENRAWLARAKARGWALIGRGQ